VTSTLPASTPPPTPLLQAMKSPLLIIVSILLLPIASVVAFSPSSTTTTLGASSLLSTKQQWQQHHRLFMLPIDKNDEVSSSSSSSSTSSFHPFPSSSILSSTLSSSTQLYATPPKSNREVSDGSADVRQLLGVKGASSTTTDIWKIRLQLTKPVTWIPLIWGVMCGAAASGNYHWMWNPFDPTDRDVALGFQDATKGLVAMILAGPFLTGYTQTINDW